MADASGTQLAEPRLAQNSVADNADAADTTLTHAYLHPHAHTVSHAQAQAFPTDVEQDSGLLTGTLTFQRRFEDASRAAGAASLDAALLSSANTRVERGTGNTDDFANARMLSSSTRSSFSHSFRRSAQQSFSELKEENQKAQEKRMMESEESREHKKEGRREHRKRVSSASASKEKQAASVFRMLFPKK